MRNVLNSYGRALLSQLHGKILLLSIAPFILSLILWGALLYVGLQPLIDSLHALFTQYDFFRTSGQMLATFGLGTLKAARDNALLQVGFFGGFRRSELVGIKVDHITWEAQGITLTLPRSKTDQTGEGVAKAIPYSAGPCCPHTH